MCIRETKREREFQSQRQKDRVIELKRVIKVICMRERERERERERKRGRVSKPETERGGHHQMKFITVAKK